MEEVEEETEAVGKEIYKLKILDLKEVEEEDPRLIATDLKEIKEERILEKYFLLN